MTKVRKAWFTATIPWYVHQSRGGLAGGFVTFGGLEGGALHIVQNQRMRQKGWVSRGVNLIGCMDVYRLYAMIDQNNNYGPKCFEDLYESLTGHLMELRSYTRNE